MLRPMEQLCAVWHGKHDLRLERRPVPALGTRDVLLEVALCGVCGTDVHIVEGEYPLVKPPRVLGHEFSGTVRGVGSGVTSVHPGARVAVDPTLSCGACFYCRQGLPLMCENRVSHHGGLGEFVVLPEQTVYPLPASVSLVVAALAEPLSCCLHTIDLAGIRPGASVAVVGAGTIGLMLLQLARRAGATRILVSEPSSVKRDIARRLGADVLVDPLHEDVQAAARDM